jgi:hypothetical protein
VLAGESAATGSPAPEVDEPAPPVPAPTDTPEVDEPATPASAPPDSGPTAPAPVAPTIRKIDSPEPVPVNLMDAAGSPVAKRVGPILAAIAIIWLLKKLFGRSK